MLGDTTGHGEKGKHMSNYARSVLAKSLFTHMKNSIIRKNKRAASVPNINTLSDEKDPPTPDKVVERDKCDEGSKDGDEESSEACEQSLDHIPIAADAEPNLAINHSSPTTDINHSNKKMFEFITKKSAKIPFFAL